ncbi:UDP-2,4-diacetamido-2,4,6-trideoxy-beta-L-altropyranose hydrolase [Desulfovibrio sp. ZJ369]|uniref:UDP-2,4-diacetamido-2,4, 6-trideoxy-beta-L-altropyranose hydrolase n=1 Tax=Desulfovibrio sp. ZJ369 TaxID=2709793 RepID=UPI0013EA1B62|nr:UDP-2,4-diacetamido-2,4,6-trideoxy-beta-L-altropyranose hydrolase [Desulfovibrio sp. ZJ369]
MSTILIRADAAPRMGTGHVMRCLALAQAARREGLDVQMICRLGVDWLRERLAREDIPLHGLPAMPPVAEAPDDLLRQLQTANLPAPGTATVPIWVVLDGYHFDTACQKAVMQAGYRLLVIDDYAHLPEYHCDVLLNQNIGAELLTYQGNIGRKLLGLDYVLLRQEFWDAQKKAQQRSRPAQPRNILVTLGGGNCIEHLEKVAADMCLPELAGRTIRVIQGAMDADRIREAFAQCPAQLEILPRVGDMPALLLDTDLCITAGGSTCWELCCLGVPFLVLQTAENQIHVVSGLIEGNFALPYTSLHLEQTLKGSNREQYINSASKLSHHPLNTLLRNLA